MTERVMQEIKRLQQEGPIEGPDRSRQGDGAARLRNGAEAERLLARAAADGEDLQPRPGEILTRSKRIDAITPQVLQEVFKQYFPAERSTIVTLIPSAVRLVQLSSCYLCIDPPPAARRR